MKVALSLAILILALPLAAQETFVHPIPPGCSSVTVPATPTMAGSVTITCPPLQLTNPSVTLPPGTKGIAYNQNIAALVVPFGGVAPYSYTLNKKGPVPPTWLKLSPKGVVSGTPTATGTVNFAFTVYDSSAKLTQNGQGSFSVAVVSRDQFNQLIGWYDDLGGCSGAECGTLGRYKPAEPFAFAEGEPNPSWFLSLRGSGLKTMRSTNAR
jgi:hypothetical protein